MGCLLGSGDRHSYVTSCPRPGRRSHLQRNAHAYGLLHGRDAQRLERVGVSRWRAFAGFWRCTGHRGLTGALLLRRVATG